MLRSTQAQVAMFLLQKNYLAEPRAADVTQLVRSLGGLPTSASSTPFLAALARLDRFLPNDLLTRLHQTRSLIRAELMRSVTYLVPVEMFATLHKATQRQRNQALNAEFRLWDIDNSEIERLGQAILAVIEEQPLAAEAIFERLPQNIVRELSQTSRGGRVSKTGSAALALRWLTARGDLCVSIEPGSWRSEKLVYTPLNYWYPELDLSAAPDEAEAQAALLRVYLAAFGPATEADISFWTGFGKSETARAVGALSKEITPVMVEGIPGMLLLLKDQTDRLHAVTSPAEPIINILPADDPFTTAHRASRSRYFSDRDLSRQIFSASGSAKPTILVDGRIVGVWDWQSGSGGDNLTWRLLPEVGPTLETLIEAECERVARFNKIGPIGVTARKPGPMPPALPR